MAINMTPTSYKKAEITGNTTIDAFKKEVFNRLVDSGFICSVSQVGKIVDAVFDTLTETHKYGNFINPSTKSTFTLKEVPTRIYADILQKSGGVETLIVSHPEVVYNYKNVAPEEQYKFKGNRSKDDPNIFICTDGTKINISELEKKMHEMYFSKKKEPIVLGKEGPFDPDAKIVYNYFEGGVGFKKAEIEAEEEEAEEEAIEEKKTATPVVKKVSPSVKKKEAVNVAAETDDETDDEIDEELDEEISSLSDLMDDDEDGIRYCVGVYFGLRR